MTKSEADSDVRLQPQEAAGQVSTKLVPGMYIAYDFTDGFGRRDLRAVKLSEKDYAFPADQVKTTSYGSLENLMKNGVKGGRTYMEKRPDRFLTNTYRCLELPMNYWRIPPSDAQAFLSQKDADIADLQKRIRDLEQEKLTYVKENRLDWEIPTLADLEAFRMKKEVA